MKVFSLFMVPLAQLSVLSGARAVPKRGGIDAIKKGGKVIKKGLGVIGAIGTGHEVYQHVKDRRGRTIVYYILSMPSSDTPNQDLYAN